jgi:hypothetical protein
LGDGDGQSLVLPARVQVRPTRVKRALCALQAKSLAKTLHCKHFGKAAWL